MNCDSDCTMVECGDSHINMMAGEECDDANDVRTDACPKTGPGGCKKAICGDGFVWAGQEMCDPDSLVMGVAQDSLDCDSDCTPVECGDMHVNAEASEQCDDSNDITTDACPETGPGGCKSARCGDGFVYEGVEECDPMAMGGNSCDFGETCGSAGDANECECVLQ
jgi:hypothetical protein